MGKNLPGFSEEKRADNDNRKSRVSEPEAKREAPKPKQLSWGEKWDAVRPTKTAIFWAWLASLILLLIIGFNWGGWVTGGTAQTMAATAAKAAVNTRLAPICVAQFNQDLAKVKKLVALKALQSYERGDYAGKQGWATMPGETAPDSNVADTCAELLMKIN
jgi:hypothetical protein